METTIPTLWLCTSIREAGDVKLAELIKKRQAICWACLSFRDSSVPFCVHECDGYLQYKWGNEAAKCCQGKW